MAIVRVLFDGGDVPVVTGAKPASPDAPIENPLPTGGKTNKAFIAKAGVHCYGLDTAVPYTPLWQMGRAIDGVPLDLTFKKVENPLEDPDEVEP